MVRVAGFEPATSPSQTARATKLRYTRKWWSYGDSNPEDDLARVACSQLHHNPMELVEGIEPSFPDYKTGVLAVILYQLKIKKSPGTCPGL